MKGFFLLLALLFSVTTDFGYSLGDFFNTIGGFIEQKQEADRVVNERTHQVEVLATIVSTKYENDNLDKKLRVCRAFKCVDTNTIATLNHGVIQRDKNEINVALDSAKEQILHNNKYGETEENPFTAAWLEGNNDALFPKTDLSNEELADCVDDLREKLIPTKSGWFSWLLDWYDK